MSKEITVTYWAHFTEPSGTTKQEVTAEIATLREQLATARADAFEEIAKWHGEQGERWGSKLHSKCARTIRRLAGQAKENEA